MSERIARGSDEWIERVRASSDLVEIVGERVALKRVGRNWMGLCPFHEERTPSFSVHSERQFYHCFSCKVGGDIFKYVQEIEHIGFVEAAELLSRRAGIPVPERHPGERSKRSGILETLEAAASAYEQWLADPERGASTRAYLERRGVDRDTVKLYRLGFAPAGWSNVVEKLRDRYGEAGLVEAGLALKRDGRTGLYDRFRNRLIVPLVATGGAVVGFGARALAPDDEPKYLNSPETPVYHKGSFVFGLEQARRHVEPGGEMVVVEGYFDVIALHQAGIKNVVATSGTALTPEHVKVLRRSVARVALTYDGDAAGQEAMMRSLGVLLADGLDVAVVTLPRGEDPDTLVKNGGAAAWAAARTKALDPIEYVQRHGLASGGPGDPRERALQAVVRLAAEIKDPIRFDLLVDRAGQVFGLDRRVLDRAIALKRGGQRSDAPIAAAVRARRSLEGRLERELLQALLMAPEWLDTARRELSPDDFHDPDCTSLARWLWSGADGEPDDAGAAVLMRELESTADPGDWGAVAEPAIRRLVRRRLERRSHEMQQRIAQLQQQGRVNDPETIQLLQEKQDLARSISALNR